MRFTRIKALWPEKQGFHLKRVNTGNEYIFLHLLTPIDIVIGGQSVRAKEGACILYNKFDYQEFISPDCPLLHDYFHLTGDLDGVMEKFGLSYAALYYPSNSERITSILQEIEHEMMKKPPFFEEFCESKLTELLVYIARSSPDEATSPIVDSQTYDRFIKLRRDIHDRFDSGMTVEDMAKMVNLSPSRFYSIYKSIFGISPKKDYLNIRIEHAKTLLQQKKYPISQVAMMAGYNNQYHFIRQFKEVVGVTPGKYLKTFHPNEFIKSE